MKIAIVIELKYNKDIDYAYTPGYQFVEDWRGRASAV